ncbi:MAG: DNAase [gamma proteobacterium symbiont of Stewartia floridana]|nr:TatD family hydrolase [Candidatus Thiodiazotropha taylori]RLW53976.1 MAG: DNAase [gamma proteobacterium symbiont of Stewartia floridana]MCG8090503.1 TatD family hydrolase [Candidatus Thiodiazotropha taylori]MCW4275882.1 TatD family hydrolase [Candidatus Thiodiazotropha taylori]RLW61160.1 MAG: DNAase [gamma proteobacterium symbiont of Stewartia floridana]
MGLHPQLIDAHSHFDDVSFDVDREQALSRAEQAGVTQQIIPAIKAAWWPRIKQLCLDHPGLHPSYGLHPMFLSDHQDQHIDQLSEWLAAEQPVAVGECGLDFYIEDPQPERQQRLFEAQLELADRYDLPVIIHARRSVEEVINTLRRFPGLRGMLHSYSGSEQQAHRLIEMGFYLSFGGPVTYERAKRLRHLVESLPLESLLIETDSPDQPDTQHRGERNEPAYLPLVLELFSQLRKQPTEEIAAQTRLNTQQLFRLQ